MAPQHPTSLNKDEGIIVHPSIMAIGGSDRRHEFRIQIPDVYCHVSPVTDSLFEVMYLSYGDWREGHENMPCDTILVNRTVRPSRYSGRGGPVTPTLPDVTGAEKGRTAYRIRLRFTGIIDSIAFTNAKKPRGKGGEHSEQRPSSSGRRSPALKAPAYSMGVKN